MIFKPNHYRVKKKKKKRKKEDASSAMETRHQGKISPKEAMESESWLRLKMFLRQNGKIV